MIRSFVLGAAALMLASAAQAQAPAPGPGAPPPAPPRARGPALDVAVEMAQVAHAACLANGYKTTSLIVDSAGVPVVMLSGDGAPERTQGVALGKTAVSIKYKTDSGVIADRANTDAALKAELTADPKIGVARRGAVLLKVGADVIGAFAVSGAPGGEKDEACVKAGIDKVASRLK